MNVIIGLDLDQEVLNVEEEDHLQDREADLEIGMLALYIESNVLMEWGYFYQQDWSWINLCLNKACALYFRSRRDRRDRSGSRERKRDGSGDRRSQSKERSRSKTPKEDERSPTPERKSRERSTDDYTQDKDR